MRFSDISSDSAKLSHLIEPYQNAYHCLKLRHRLCTSMSVVKSLEARRLWKFYQNIFYFLACIHCFQVKIGIVIQDAAILFYIAQSAGAVQYTDCTSAEG